MMTRLLLTAGQRCVPKCVACQRLLVCLFHSTCPRLGTAQIHRSGYRIGMHGGLHIAIGLDRNCMVPQLYSNALAWRWYLTATAVLTDLTRRNDRIAVHPGTRYGNSGMTCAVGANLRHIHTYIHPSLTDAGNNMCQRRNHAPMPYHSFSCYISQSLLRKLPNPNRQFSENPKHPLDSICTLPSH